MAIETSTDLIQQAAASVEYRTRELRLLRQQKRKLTATMEYIKRIADRYTGIEITHYTWANTDCWAMKISIDWTMSIKVKSLTTGPVPTILSFLMEAGFEMKKTEDITGNDAAYRNYKFEREADERYLKLDCKLSASVIDAPDATCRKLQIGTEVKTVPVYKLECDEIPAFAGTGPEATA